MTINVVLSDAMKNIKKNKILGNIICLKVRSAPIFLMIFSVFTLCLSWSEDTEASSWVSATSRTKWEFYGDFDWSSEDNNTVICHTTFCTVAICHYALRLQPCTVPSATSTKVFIPNRATVRDAQIAFITKNGTSGSWSTTSPSIPNGSCFAVMYWQGTNDSNTSGRIMPGSNCAKPPPLNNKCDLIGDIYFDHDTLSANAVQGSSKTEYLNVQCSMGMNITLALIGKENIPLGGGMVSELFINGENLSSAGVNISISSGGKLVPITSTLSSAMKPIAGNYIGSGIIVIQYQ